MSITYYVLAHKYKEDIFYDPTDINDETPYLEETKFALTKESAEKYIEENSLSDYTVMEVEVCPLCNKVEDDCWCGNQN
ncbi:hypothetical protein [Bacillus wiedmannii]|uniref:hypothetical protein n=1 Tax=Bacillus wiedmannii TaxID=1890302 RepID=UPI0007CA9375|nr:hypothetical protein [Bacillus wiedmannii]OAK35875.1 hypothetical protein A6284_26450 [Bacillus wiedmannii]HDR7640756.1 hypothetical protein [Bacillus wiedmannii]